MFKHLISRVRTFVVCLTSLLISMIPLAGCISEVQAAPVSSLTCQWHLVASPHPVPGQRLNEFRAVAAVAKNDIWAVGHGMVQAQTVALIAHWDGTAWHVVPVPSATEYADLYGITALSAQEAWAVGVASDAHSSVSRPLIERWNGRHWREVRSPDIGNKGSAFLTGIAGRAENNLWAVGYDLVPQGAHTLIEHWDGNAWKLVTSPNVPNAASNLLAVTVLAPNDVWAAGSSSSANGQGGGVVIEHWDGRSWKLVPGPDLGHQFATLESIAAVASNDIWAVGRAELTALILHWDGVAWKQVASPKTVSGGDLHSVGIAPSQEVWAVGDEYVVGGIRPLIAQWNGASWKSIQSPESRLPFAGWYGMSAVPGSHLLWTVGYAHEDQAATRGQTLTATSC